MVNLLILLRFECGDPVAGTFPEAAIQSFMRRVEENGGQLVDRENEQLLLCLTDMRWGLQSLRALLTDARRDGYVVRAAIVQAVLARNEPGQKPAFTARTLETLLRLVGHVDRQQVGITPKLLSLIELGAPEFAELFETPAHPIGLLPGETRTQPVLVMAG